MASTEHASAERALVQIPMPRMASDEIREIITTGLGRLGMTISDEAKGKITGTGNAAGPSLSVVVPNRNDARFLGRCIASILAQEAAPDELIVLDDESTDDSVAVIERAIAGCPFARLVRNPKNLGATENSNKGLALARGEFVHFLGANDFVMPGLYREARAMLARHPQAGLWSAMVWTVDESDRMLDLYPSAVIALGAAFVSPEEVRALIYRFGSWLTGQTVIYRREALLAVGGFDPRLRAFTDLFASHVLASRHGACFCPRPLAAMRLHDGGFLAATLRDEATFEEVLGRIRREGPLREPVLYGERQLRRVERRLRFTSLKAAATADAAAARERMARAPEHSVRWLARLWPWLPRKLVLGLLLVVLRPFDLLPSVWYRFLGAFYVALRERSREPRRNLKRLAR
jgi:glycosyltransferase involved in cell wall biosynthesis